MPRLYLGCIIKALRSAVLATTRARSCSFNCCNCLVLVAGTNVHPEMTTMRINTADRYPTFMIILVSVAKFLQLIQELQRFLRRKLVRVHGLELFLHRRGRRCKEADLLF